MRLVTYDAGSGPRTGVLGGEDVLDASALLGSRDTLRNLRALLELPDVPLLRLRKAVASGEPAPSIPLVQARLRAPVLQPPTVRDFFAFEEHASGSGSRELSEAWYRLSIFY